jgi:hypothetical protein
VTVLVEGDRDKQFVRGYLSRLGFDRHAARFEPVPAGKQSGEQWVRQRYATIVGACRARAARAMTAAVVVIDADTEDVARRRQQLAAELERSGLAPRSVDERIAHFIPKRNIETWILCLQGIEVDETSDYKRDTRIEDRIRPAALAFFELTRPNTQPQANCIPSLLVAIPEARRLE